LGLCSFLGPPLAIYLVARHRQLPAPFAGPTSEAFAAANSSYKYSPAFTALPVGKKPARPWWSKMLEIILLVAAGTLVGNEICIAAFVHPIFYKLPKECHVRVAQPVARLLGAVMPFWYIAVVALTGAECYLSREGNPRALHLLEAAEVIFLVSIAFTLLGPVPINNQIARFVPEQPPANWLALRKRWDRLHAIRVAIILVALILLTAGTVIRWQ
jgi:hypothetical protein